MAVMGEPRDALAFEEIDGALFVVSRGVGVVEDDG
jgi:hypothetical protein